MYTIAKAFQGLADYLNKYFDKPSVAIGYDSRIKSDVFAKAAAGVFAANGVQVNIWPVLMPVPTVSFAARYLGTSAGVMVTASYNLSKYNSYYDTNQLLLGKGSCGQRMDDLPQSEVIKQCWRVTIRGGSGIRVQSLNLRWIFW